MRDDIFEKNVVANDTKSATTWWRRRGSNSRPYGCEPYALPAELRPHLPPDFQRQMILYHNFAGCKDSFFLKIKKFQLPIQKEYSKMNKLIKSPPHAAAEPVSRNGCPRIMSGGEPSSIKRDVPCAARAPVPQLHTEDLFYPGGVSCSSPCTANGGPRHCRM